MSEINTYSEATQSSFKGMSTVAEDIVRRKNSIELKRLELQDRAKRYNYLNTQRYFDELDDINKLDVNLREELGDEFINYAEFTWFAVNFKTY